jgi:hypothetical protein
MKVTLGNDYYVKIDSYNHTLYKFQHVSVKTGAIYKEPREVTVGYYSNMERAIKGAVQDAVAESDLELNLDGYIEEVKRLWEEISNGK